MLIKETWLEVKEEKSPDGIDRRAICLGESDLYEPFTDDTGKLFRSLQREYGKCVSKMYIDTATGSKSIGWVFEKKVKYQDCNKYYLQETWVELHETQPERTVKYNYHFL